MSVRQFRRARERQVQREERRAELRRKTKVGAAAGAAIGATALFAPPAQAATFTVNSLDDPGAGTCDATECTLREAVEEANDADGADTIVFASSLSGTIHLAEGDIEIYDGNALGDAGGLDIQGPGPGVITVDADYDSRVFDVGGFFEQGTPVRIGGLKLRAGSSTRDGGAIRNWPAYGGAAASLTVDDTVITDSYAEDDGGAIFNYEEYLDSLAITNTRISDNEAGESGGGVFTVGSSVTISGSELDGNTAFEDGGGLFVADAPGVDSSPGASGSATASSPATTRAGPPTTRTSRRTMFPATVAASFSQTSTARRSSSEPPSPTTRPGRATTRTRTSPTTRAPAAASSSARWAMSR